jgi:hypothetical protein
MMYLDRHNKLKTSLAEIVRENKERLCSLVYVNKGISKRLIMRDTYNERCYEKFASKIFRVCFTEILTRAVIGKGAFKLPGLSMHNTAIVYRGWDLPSNTATRDKHIPSFKGRINYGETKGLEPVMKMSRKGLDDVYIRLPRQLYMAMISRVNGHAGESNAVHTMETSGHFLRKHFPEVTKSSVDNILGFMIRKLLKELKNNEVVYYRSEMGNVMFYNTPSIQKGAIEKLKNSKRNKLRLNEKNQ